MPDGRPLPLPIVYAAAGAGHAPVVKAYTAETGDLRFAITAYEPGFQGGVRVGTGDFNGDGIPDVVTAPGPDHAPVIKVFDSKTGNQISGPLGSFLAFAPSVDGGVYVAAADVDGDRKPDIIASAVTAFGPRVKVFSGASGGLIADFFVPDMASANGLTVAAADVTGDGKAEVVLGSGLGGDGWVRTYDPLSGVVISGPLGNFRAFGNDYGGGVYVGSDALAADVDGDGTLDLAVGTRGPNAQARVRVFSGSTGAVLHDFLPFGPDVQGGARVGLAYVTDDAYADMVVGTGPGNVGAVRVFDGVTGNQLPAPLGEYAPFGTDTVGVFVAASNDPSGQIYGDFYARVGYTTGALDLGDLMDNNENMDPNDITVWIDWDDQTPLSAGWIVCTGDDGMGQITYDIMGEHTYQLPSDEMAPYVASVTVYDAGVAILAGTVTVTVPDPTISLSDQPYVPVNANRDDNSPWKKDAAGNPLTGLPMIRDFDPLMSPMRNLTGWNGTDPLVNGTAPLKDFPIISDPDLKPMTAIVLNGPPQGQITVNVSGPSAGAIRLWADQTKEHAISLAIDQNGTGYEGTLPDYPVSIFYIEGINPSIAVNDITIQARYTLGPKTYTNDKQLTVTPVINVFNVNPVLSQTTFFRNNAGDIEGLNSGRQSANGAAQGTGDYGAVFYADLNRNGIGGKGAFIQNVTNITNGNPSGLELSNGNTYNLVLKGTLNYSISDSPTAGVVPFYTGLDPKTGGTAPYDDILNATRHAFWAPDTPAFGATLPNTTIITRMDFTFHACLYLVWTYTDGSIYTLAYDNWSVVFRATTIPFFGLTISSDSSVSSEGRVIAHPVPDAMTTPVFNGNFEFR